MSVRLLILGTIVILAACREQTRSSAAPSPTDARREALAAREEADRRELVSPPPLYWRQEPDKQRLKAVLDAEKRTLRAGDAFRYRLQLQNVGQDDVVFWGKPSFIKQGETAIDRSYKFLLTFPDGAESELPPPLMTFRALPPAERPARAPDNELFLHLHPGEILTNRGGFRDLITAYAFDEPGRYSLRLVYDRGDLHAESNPVAFVVQK